MAFLRNLKDCAISVIAIFIVTAFLMVIGVVTFDLELFIKFVIGSILLIFGQAIFLMGAESSLIDMGKKVGNSMTKQKKIWIILLFGFLFTFTSTIAEPDVNLYIAQIVGIAPNISSFLLLFIFGIGVGASVVFGLFRIIKSIPQKYVIAFMYILLLALMFFAPGEYIGIAFDGAAVTTGPITGPFVICMTIGIVSLRTKKDNKDDSFGIITIASFGTSIVLLLTGIVLGSPTTSATTSVAQSGTIWVELLNNVKEVALVMVPIVLFIVLCQIVLLKLPKFAVKRIAISLFVTYIGLVLFLTGITYGFSPMGYYLGEFLAMFTQTTSYGLLVVLLVAAVLGFLVVFTEPSIVVFAKQVEDVTGNIKKNLVMITFGLSVAVGMVVSIIRIYFGIPIWYFIVPLMVITGSLVFVLPQFLVGMSFDTGGLASGTVVAAFLLPLATGLAGVVGNGGIADGFGMIALVMFFPILCFELLGLVYVHKKKQNIVKDKMLYRRVSLYIAASLRINQAKKSAKKSARVFIKQGGKDGKN